MDPEKYARVREVFLRACDAPQDRRIALVDELCGDDAAVRAEVLSLLVHHEPAASKGFMDGSAARMLAESDAVDAGRTALFDVERPGGPADPPPTFNRAVMQGARHGGESGDASNRHRTNSGAGGMGRGDIDEGGFDDPTRDERGPRRQAKSGSSRGDSGFAEHGRFTPGTILAGRYRIVAMLGEGGMGEVYRADDLRLGQAVALKFLSAQWANNPDRLRELNGEVRTARQVSHPNVCRVYDIAEVDGDTFLSMEYVDGENLDSLLRRIGRLPGDKAVQIAQQLCAGLQAIHERGLLHRDLKPANILIDGRGQARIADFGLAAFPIAGVAGSFRDKVAGTPGYLAPEALAGDAPSVRSEIYSLGLILYEMFTGRAAYEADSVAELLRRQRETDPARPSSFREGIDPEVDEIIQRCLERDPQQRPASARSVAMRLPGGDPLAAALAAGDTPSPELVAAARRTGLLSPRIAIMLCALIAAGLVAVFALSGRALLLARVGLAKSPDVLRERSREIIEANGDGASAAHSVIGFEIDRGALSDPGGRGDIESLRAMRPPPVRFWYRQSPQPLAPINLWAVRPSLADPPPTVPNMISVVLDPAGQLLEYRRTPEDAPRLPPEAQAVAAQDACDYAPLFKAAGLDPIALSTTRPSRAPPIYASDLSAWEGRDAKGVPIRIEGASIDGHVMYFKVSPAIEPAEAKPALSLSIARLLDFTIFLSVLCGGGLLAWMNVRLGRGDRRSAFRLACIAFAAQLAFWLLTTTYYPSLEAQFVHLFASLGMCVFLAFLLWMYYIALEPLLRRSWPELIISWTRLLAGRFSDPLVGRDVLIGVCTGVCSALVIELDAICAGPRGVDQGGPARNLGDLFVLLGPRPAAGTFAIIAILAVYMALGSFLLVCLFRAALGNRRRAAIAFYLVHTTVFALFIAHSPISWLFAAILWAIITTALLRFGMVAFTVGSFTYLTLVALPTTADWSAWYAGPSIFGLGLLAALCALGLRNAVVWRRCEPAAGANQGD